MGKNRVDRDFVNKLIDSLTDYAEAQVTPAEEPDVEDSADEEVDSS